MPDVVVKQLVGTRSRPVLCECPRFEAATVAYRPMGVAAVARPRLWLSMTLAENEVQDCDEHDRDGCHGGEGNPNGTSCFLCGGSVVDCVGGVLA